MQKPRMPLAKGTHEDSVQHPGILVISEDVYDRIRATSRKEFKRPEIRRESKESMMRRARHLDEYTNRFNSVMERNIFRCLDALEKQLKVPDVCVKQQNNLTNCYRENLNQPLMCDSEVDEYINCIMEMRNRQLGQLSPKKSL